MIRPIPPTREENRAVSVAVTHILAIGITTILIVGLLTAAGGMAEQEQERSAQKQLQMIGSSMANQIEQVGKLGRRGANVTVRDEFEGTVSGQSYTVEFENDCAAPTINTDACLVLDMTNSDISTTVGVNNRSAVTFEHLGSGKVRIVSEPGGAPGDAPYDPSILEQVGVGGEIYDLPPGTGSLAELNKPPIPKFSVDPESPQYRDIIILNASESSDPEGTISEYIWNFSGGGDNDLNQTTKDPTFAIPTGHYDKLDTDGLDVGRHTVELTVVDSAGNKGSTSNLVKVSGLVYNGNAKARDYNGDGDPGGLSFNLINKHSHDANVTEMYISLSDKNINITQERMYNNTPPGYPHEILINNTNQTGTVEAGDSSSDYIEIHEGGRVIQINEWDQFTIVKRNGRTNDTADVHFIEFYDKDRESVNMTGKSGNVSFRYYIEHSGEDVYFSTQFDFSANSPYIDELISSTYAQNWQSGSGGHKAQLEFNRIKNIEEEDVTVEVIDTSSNLREYNWSHKGNAPYVNETGISDDKVKVTGNLKDISISNEGYVIAEVTVENAYGSETKRIYINVDQ